MIELPNNLETILHIGAGRGDELPAYLESDAKRILLVEPNPSLAEQLRRHTQNDERVQVLELAITDDPVLDQLHEYNLPEATSLYQPTGLRQIFPGLRVTAQHLVATKTPEELLEQYPLVGDHNLLVIQAPGAESVIINDLVNANKLGTISHIQLTLPAEVYYEGSQRAEDVLQALSRRGYNTEHTNTQNPDWPEYHLECNPLARRLQDVDLEKQSLVQALQQSKNEKQSVQATLETAKQEFADAREEFDREQQAWQKQKQELTNRLEGAMQHSTEADRTVENLQSREMELGAALNQSSSMVRQLRAQLDAAQGEAEALKSGVEEAKKAASIAESEKTQLTERQQHAEKAKKQAEEELQKHKESLNSRKQELQAKTDELEKQKSRLESLEQENAQLKGQVQQLQSQLSADTKGQKEIADLKKHMEHLFDQQGLQLEQAANALGRHVTSTAHNTAKELEAGFQLQQQLGTDFASLAERGSRLPSTVALQLSRQLKTNPYDLVIEMGSGVTTSFLAHTLRKRAANQSEDESDSTGVARYVEPSDDDLPKRILCFEHNRSTVNNLQNTLKQSGLTPIITLQYAPLVACAHQGKEYLYYDCGSRLRQIAQLFENRTARVFILLNDVAGESRPDPIVALPQLLQYLSAHKLDVVVSTSHANTGLIGQWQQLLDSRGLEYRPAVSFGNESTKLMRINP